MQELKKKIRKELQVGLTLPHIKTDYKSSILHVV